MDRCVSDLEEAPHRSGVRARRQRALAAAALALLAVAAGAQEAKKEPAPAAPQQKDERPPAAEILARAIEAQGLPPVRDPAADLPLALRAKVNLKYRDQKGNAISVDAERKFLGSKDGTHLIWTRITPTSAKERETIVAFDGNQPWFWSKERGLRLLTEPGMEHDREVLAEDLESTELLARSFLLRNLPSQLEDLRLERAETVADPPTDHLTWVLAGKAKLMRGGEPRPVTFELWIDQKSHWLHRARIEIAGETPLRIDLKKHERRDGVIVPGRIDLFWKDEKEPRQTLYVETLELAPKLEPAEFAPPKSQ